ncbi:stressosome-associated protein Prli42 [Oceanobacillus alkalisoli]|uniref:stressosome-associated protein Prli42 n=1 Tax=Oceanobacillus alkalisoli TaxID=2925113 RepID=UPI0021065058|nr:stressosome-associated protein Prli42 [Oceanobacillus alkalisoli]
MFKSSNCDKEVRELSKQSYSKRQSKRQRRTKIIVYVMIILMLLSTFTYGLAAFAF